MICCQELSSSNKVCQITRSEALYESGTSSRLGLAIVPWHRRPLRKNEMFWGQFPWKCCKVFCVLVVTVKTCVLRVTTKKGSSTFLHPWICLPLEKILLAPWLLLMAQPLKHRKSDADFLFESDNRIIRLLLLVCSMTLGHRPPSANARCHDNLTIGEIIIL